MGEDTPDTPTDRLITSNVFVDAEAFRAAGLNWSSSLWKSFANLSQKLIIRPIITSITVREIEARIRESVEEAKIAYNKHRSIFSQNKLEWPEKNQAISYNVVVGNFRSFIKDCKFRTVDITRNTENIFDRYFDYEPPFSKRKKYEFPDAFVLESIREWASEGMKRVYIISNDPDVKDYCNSCSRFFHVDDIKRFLSIASSEKNFRDRVENFLSNDKKLISDILNKVEKLKSAHDIVSDISVTDHHVSNIYIIDDGEEEINVEMELFVDIDFKCINLKNIDKFLRDDNEDSTISCSDVISLNVEVDIGRCKFEKDRFSVKSWNLESSLIEVSLPNDFPIKEINLSA